MSSRGYILAALALLSAVFASAQEPHDNYGIPKFDSVVQNPALYNRILDKFKAGVERPSVSECTIAYYGFPYQEGYTGTVEGEEEMQRAIMEGRFLPAYLMGKQILENNPVSLTTLYWTLHAATQIREPWEVRNSLRARYNSLCFVISQSGDGTSPETAFKVIYLGDIYTYTAMELSLEIGEGYLLDDRWMELEVTPVEAKFKHYSIFFDTWVRQ